MTAVWVRARAEIRDRWRALVSLALVIGLGGGFVLAAMTGARRTDSVYSRFLAATGASDVEVIDDNSDVATPIPIEKVIALPQVASAGRYVLNYFNIGGDDFAFVAPADDRFGTTIDRIRVVRGREPRAPDEIAISLYLADRHHLNVGDAIPFFGADVVGYLQSLGIPPARIQQLQQFRFRVVGIEAGPGELPPQQIGNVAAHVSRAFYESNPLDFSNLVGKRQSLAVRLKDPRMESDFAGALQKLVPRHIIFSGTQRELGAGTTRSFHLQAIAFWLLALLIGAVSLLIFGQSIARQAALESGDAPTLHALGMGRVQLFAVGLARAAVIGVAGAFVSVVVGYLLSPLSPIGLARTVEPHRGFLADGLILGVGAAAVLLAVVVLAIVPTWRAVRRTREESERSTRVSRFAAALSAAGSPPAAVTGARLAFQTGRGRTAVPVRSSLAGATIGLAALVAALIFGSSLVHLTHSPALYGWRWDYAVTNYGENDYAPYADRIGAVPGVASYTLGASGVALRVNGLAISLLLVDAKKGDALPPVVEGRMPARAGEIVLGTKALRELHKKIGDMVTVEIAFAQGSQAAFPDVKPQAMRIVGRGVFPPSIDSELGRGGMATSDNFPDLPAELKADSELLLKFLPGADRAQVLGAIREALKPAGRPGIGLVFTEIPNQTPGDLLSFGQVHNLPLILAGLLGLLAAATVAHTMISSIHRRARDLAVLKTLGFVRGQVRALVAWQSLFLALATLIVGIPAGVVIGRWTWTVFADRVGVVPQVRVPLLAVGLVIPATVVLANLLGVVPARSAARTQPAIVLRTE